MNLFDDLRNKITKSVAETSHASKRMIETSKINYKLKEKRQEADVIAAKIGWITYKEWDKEQSITLTKDLIAVFQQLQYLHREMKALEVELENIKNDKIIQPESSMSMSLPTSQSISLLIYVCPYCAHQVGEDDRQCGNCNRQYY